MRHIEHSYKWPSRQAIKLRHKIVCFLAVGIFLGTIAGASLVIAQLNSSSPDPVELLRGMTDSIGSLTYEGTFVYAANGQVETMKIMHSNDGGSINEYLTSLNGEAREVFRDDSLVTCIWPDSQSTITMESKKRTITKRYDFAFGSNDNYQFIASPDDRVAGRDAYVIDVKSNDDYRYSYKFWIDKRTKMLLRSISLDSSNAPVEQVMFTTIQFPDAIMIDDVNAKIARLDYENVTYNDATDLSETTLSPIRFESLPDGYTRVAEMLHPKTADYDPVRHIYLSDGMASISVYVQFEYTPIESNIIGLSMLGGVAAYTRKLGSAYATVMGKVPSETVRTIAQAVSIDNTISVR